MQGFNRAMRGYDPREVNRFIDDVIKETEKRQEEANNLQNEINKLQTELAHYKQLETSLNKSLLIAEEAGDKIKAAARQERNFIIEDAKNNANRIVNEALIRAEKTEYEADLLQKNIRVFKNKLKTIVEAQLEIIDDIDKTEL